MEICEFCNREFSRHTSRIFHQNRCSKNPNKIEKTVWNKGLTKETDDRVKKYNENQSKTKNSNDWKLYHRVWNKGLTKETDDRVKKCNENQSKTKNSNDWKTQSRDRIIKKYGCHFTQTEEYKENRKKIYKEKYGYENPLQNPEIFEKVKRHRYLHHEYTFPSGNKILVQGYEWFAIDKLLEMNINEIDIKTECKDIPIIFYELDGKTKRYFPDLFVDSLNKIIEVKSDYTVRCNKKKNLAKQQECKSMGYLHEIWICYPKSNEITIVDDLETYYNGLLLLDKEK